MSFRGLLFGNAECLLQIQRSEQELDEIWVRNAVDTRSGCWLDAPQSSQPVPPEYRLLRSMSFLRQAKCRHSFRHVMVYNGLYRNFSLEKAGKFIPDIPRYHRRKIVLLEGFLK
jgi:hypothetical protein